MRAVTGRKPIGNRAALVAALVLAGSIFVASGDAIAAGAAFAVDTAELSDPGNCKVEGWASFARNSDALATVNPACVVSALTPTEISLQVARSRGDDEWAISLTPKAKARLLPTAIGSFGYALAAGFSYDPQARETTSVFAYVPATLRLSEVLRVNVNAGWQNDPAANRDFATYGLGLDWRMTDTFILTLETFGQTGPSTGIPSETRPKFQAGVRYRPIDSFNLDLIYGRNINGENSDWITVATTVRFSAK